MSRALSLESTRPVRDLRDFHWPRWSAGRVTAQVMVRRFLTYTPPESYLVYQGTALYLH